MSYFDESKAVFARNVSPERIYHSYMCPSKREYLNKGTGTDNPSDKPTWLTPHTRISQDKRLQQNFSKLRDILSDTISNLTRENNLKKGESVELTLEIELMKSIENTPTNSLVEVTIIQHNNKCESKNKIHRVPKKTVFKIEQDKLLMKESPQKKQTWFKRVISRENTVNNKSVELRNTGDEHEILRKHTHKPLFCSTANQRYNELEDPAIHDARANFINILPVETNNKGYWKITQKENRQEPSGDNCTDQELSKNLTVKNSLMTKISNIFLPPKKPSKNEVVKTALTALKNEIGNMKTTMDEKENYKYTKNRDNTAVHNLGKLVNNILFDVMASMDGDNENEIKEELSLPLQYQSFFEPVTKTSKKHKEKKLTKRITSPSINKLYRSHSDTCCVRPLNSKIEPQLKSSNSLSDCKVHKGPRTLHNTQFAGDSKETHKKRRRSNQRDYSKGRKKNLKHDRRILPNTTVKDDPKDNLPHQKALFSKSSLIQWNGKHVKVSKDIKARIEMLIVNELENLALKEGMECDVTPLSTTDEGSRDSKTVEKMSSFMCELDISDKNVKKMMKGKKSLHKKVSVHRPKEILKNDQYNATHKARTYTTITSSGTQTQKIKNSNNLNDKPKFKNEVKTIKNNDRYSIFTQSSDAGLNSVEIKYVNKNMHNWSAESQTITYYSPEMITSNQQNTMYECTSQNCKSKKDNKFISTGFVKVINSDNSTWNKYYPQTDVPRCRKLIPTQNLPEINLNTTEQTSSATGKSSSKMSNDLDSSIEIELDIEDLEYILKEAKQNYKADKVLIEAKCVHPKKKCKSLKPKLTGKNNPSYTNQLLTNAAKKLEKYAKTTSKNKKSKY